jgi:hypothetical protein
MGRSFLGKRKPGYKIIGAKYAINNSAVGFHSFVVTPLLYCRTVFVHLHHGLS